MDAATREKIFTPFFTTKERGRGTGLGLSTVCDIARNSGGDVTVESTPGQGAVFRVFIPLAERVAPTVATTAPTPPELPAGAREGVLVVEDEEILRTLMVELLEAQGYRGAFRVRRRGGAGGGGQMRAAPAIARHRRGDATLERPRAGRPGSRRGGRICACSTSPATASTWRWTAARPAVRRNLCCCQSPSAARS